jgi:hypothetical protein
VDGYIGFDGSAPFDFDQSNGIGAGQYDFAGAVAHEISEVMGRVAGSNMADATHYRFYLLDLFRYLSPGGHNSLDGSKPSYFSYDDGLTKLGNFNTDLSGDYGDWASGTGYDAFDAFALASGVNPVSPTDLTVLDVLGWDPTSSIADSAPQLTNSSQPRTPRMCRLMLKLYLRSAKRCGPA